MNDEQRMRLKEARARRDRERARLAESTQQSLEELLVQAKTAFDALTPAQQAHHRHEQRIDFAAGNVALSWPESAEGGEDNLVKARRLVRQSVGPCPCGECVQHVWLDDERDPSDHGFAGALWFRTGEELVKYLERHGCEHIHTLSLDHDLGEGRMTGYDVICWIEAAVRDGAQPPQHINLHTQNPVGKERMRAARHNIYAMVEARLRGGRG